ncbi:MAG: (Fe-S)-binding protein [Firmicutes bacterium]|nr:(Fe-S)-binding protein [Bacillota bacterium]
MFKDTTVVKDMIKKCVRCGQCRVVCPIFREYGTENYSPRGQVFLVQMIRDGQLPASDKVAEKLGDCLMCETCYRNCPSAIPVHEMVAEARSFVNQQRPSAVRDLVFERMWSHPGRLRTAIGAMSLADTLGLRSLGRLFGITRLLPGDLPKAEKILARVPRAAAHNQLPSFNPAVGPVKLRAAYFLGCASDLLLPDIPVAAVKALTRSGADVVIPQNINCCGLPHLANGRKDLTVRLAAKNLLALIDSGADFVVSDCASCTSALSSKYYSREGLEEAAADGLLVDERGREFDLDKLIEAAEWLKTRVVDLNVMLVDKLGMEDLKPRFEAPLRVTYHDPCHLSKAQKITQQPRQLLQSIEGLDFREMKEADVCCGGSGTFGMSHYDLSMKILGRKVDSILETGAQVVATSCPSCITQLSHGLREAGSPVEVLHPVQLLVRGLK